MSHEKRAPNQSREVVRCQSTERHCSRLATRTVKCHFCGPLRLCNECKH